MDTSKQVFIDYVVRKDGKPFYLELDGTDEKGFTQQEAMQKCWTHHVLFATDSAERFEIFKRVITLTEEILPYEGEYFC